MTKVNATRRASRLLALITSVALCAIMLFLLCYQKDNKYTVKGPLAENGVLILSAQDLQMQPFVYLITGWEIYRNKLLAPVDFLSGLNLPDESVFIGQYGGMEGIVGSGRSPHGSATYRLNIDLPPEMASYMLEVPEIYSAYRLYINGEQKGQMGNPAPQSYRAETGNTKVTVHCKDRMEIIFAVSDFSHFYSGIVYPPAFGKVSAVDKLLNTRLGLRFSAVALALCVGLLYGGIWLLLKKNKQKKDTLPILYGALCLCFALYISYPIVKTLMTTGSIWYTLENLAFPSVLLLVTRIQSRICSLPMPVAKGVAGLGIFVCGWALAVPNVLSSSLSLMLMHSVILQVYTWICAVFLLLTSVYSAYRRNMHSETMLAGSVFFGVSLVMDRLFPLFEPIRFGWFAEISGGFFVICIGVVMAAEIATQFRLRLLFEERVDSVTRMIEVQKAYYPEILKKESDLRMAQHDFRHHITVIRELAASAEISKLMEYTESFDERLHLITQISYCKNYVVDMLLRRYAGLAEGQSTIFTVEASLPNTLPFEDADLCVMVSNLLENALEASLTVPNENRRIVVRIRCKMNHFGISVDNVFDGVIKMHNHRYLSRKRSGREGIGLQSVHAICRSYGGSAEFSVKENNIFHNELLLPIFREKG